EELVIAELREDVDERAEARHRREMDARRHDHADVDREVHIVDARHVPRREHRLADRGLLLRAQAHTAAGGLDRRTGRRGSGLVLRRRGGLALPLFATLLSGRRLLTRRSPPPPPLRRRSLPRT